MTAFLRTALPHFKQIDWFERTTSTNADLLTKARTSQLRLARPWLLGAHLQEQGRGRTGRTWQNRAGANLMFSCAFDVFLPARQLPALSPLAGLAASEALRELLGAEWQTRLLMKWPNDVQWQFAKLAGILVEITRAGTSKLSADHHVVIIGIGLNLDDARSLSQSLNRQVADWSEVTAQDTHAATIPIAAIVAAIARAWYTCLNDVIGQGFSLMPTRYAKVDALAGQHVNIIDNGRILHAGIACGVNELGQLLVRTSAGEVAVSVGEVSVRPQK
jgi:BirA family biotin operon repressor/biotin-[acetyl-CoA-carboxylase] ligase